MLCLQIGRMVVKSMQDECEKHTLKLQAEKLSSDLAKIQKASRSDSFSQPLDENGIEINS